MNSNPANATDATPQTSAADFFAELRALATTQTPCAADYALLYGILSRFCSLRSQALHADYSGLFSRLYAVCRAAHIDYHAADAVRRRARLFMTRRAETEFSASTFQADIAVVAALIARLSDCALPQDFHAALPAVANAAPRTSCARSAFSP